MKTMRIIIAIVCTGGIAAADPDPVSVPTFTLQTALFTQTPPTIVPSLRLEAARVAHEKYDGQWRYPEPGTLGGIDGNGIFFGHGYYRPRSGRSARAARRVGRRDDARRDPARVRLATRGRRRTRRGRDNGRRGRRFGSRRRSRAQALMHILVDVANDRLCAEIVE